MAITHIVASPTGIVHIAPYRNFTKCGRVIDLSKWTDLGQTRPLETPTQIRKRMDTGLFCDRCAPPARR